MKVAVIATIVLALGVPMIASAQAGDGCVPGKPEPVFSSYPKGWTLKPSPWRKTAMCSLLKCTHSALNTRR